MGPKCRHGVAGGCQTEREPFFWVAVQKTLQSNQRRDELKTLTKPKLGGTQLRVIRQDEIVGKLNEKH